MSEERFRDYRDRQIDLDKLKAAAPLLLDTGVVLRALGEADSDPRRALCLDLVRKALKHDVMVMVAAPTLAEILRHRRGTPDRLAPPLAQGIVTVAFDAEAASFCGANFQMTAINDAEIALKTGQKGFLKYDALVISCAARWRAKTVVTLDSKLKRRLASSIHLEIVEPTAFALKQVFPEHLQTTTPSDEGLSAEGLAPVGPA